MAKYEIITYESTGFNAVNIPDSPDLLDQCKHTEWKLDDDSMVSMVQNRNLTSIRLPGAYTTFQNVDYVKVGDWYYSVPPGGINKVANNVVEIQLLSDPVTSAGGFKREGDTVSAKFKILDGVTERCTTSKDGWGIYDMDDPLTAPQQPLKIKTEWIEPDESTPTYTHPEGNTTGLSPVISGKNAVFLESTVDLPLQAEKYDGKTFKDVDENGVTVPMVCTNTQGATEFGFVDGTENVDDGTRVYIVNDDAKLTGKSSAADTIKDGVSVVRALGVEQGSIINQWRVPLKYIKKINTNYYASGDTGESGAVTTTNSTGQYVREIVGNKGEMKGKITPDYYKAKNKRLLYGDYNKYGLITTAGNSCEFNPEEITDEKSAPGITFESDVRPKGKPYYRFTTINSSSEFWRNALAGSEWQNVPLVYQGSSGSALTRLNYQNSRKIADLSMEQERQRSAERNTMTTIGALEKSADTLAGINSPANLVGGLMSIGATAANAAATIAINNNSLDRAQAMYQQQKENELSGLYQVTNVYAPTVNFPYNADILRDIKGNAVLLYKYEYSDGDAERIDKLLTMYGYKTAQHLTIGHFYRRKHFDYVQCSNVSVGGLSKWWNDQIGMMLRNGVRVWHEIPNITAYNDNPIL